LGREKDRLKKNEQKRGYRKREVKRKVRGGARKKYRPEEPRKKRVP